MGETTNQELMKIVISKIPDATEDEVKEVNEETMKNNLDVFSHGLSS